MLFPQNIDGETWGNREYGLPVPTKKPRATRSSCPAIFQPRTNDFSAQIADIQAKQAARSSAASPIPTI